MGIELILCSVPLIVSASPVAVTPILPGQNGGFVFVVTTELVALHRNWCVSKPCAVSPVGVADKLTQ